MTENVAAPAAAAPAAVAATAPAAAAPEAPAAPAKKKVEKTSFDVKVNSLDSTKQTMYIKEVRAALKLTLQDARAAVLKCPGVIATNIPKEEAEKLKAAMEAAGATIELI